jgi:hypothetical protein
VERRAENEIGYVSIGFVNGKGDYAGESAYRFLDRNVTPGTNYYYRLRQEDFNGGFVFSNVVTARIEPMGGLLANFYPNPTTGLLNIELNGIPEAPLLVEVFNLLGARVHRESFAPDAAGSALQIDLRALPAGSYLVKLRSGTANLVKQIVVE